MAEEKKPNNKKTGLNRHNKKDKNEKPEFEQKLVDLSRVTRVTRGGKQLSFRALVVLGDKKNRVAYGIAKGKDVTIAVSKAVDQAKKRIVTIPLTSTNSIPHNIREKYNSAYVMLKPAPQGTGIKAGGPVRVVLDLAGVANVVGKMMGSKNKVNNVKCVYHALTKIKPAKEFKTKKDKKTPKPENKK